MPNLYKIGIISDTHDNLPKIKKAVEVFNTEEVNFVLHAGDIVAPFSIEKLFELKCDWRAVFGNNDGEKEGLRRKSNNKICEPPIKIELGNKKILLTHDLAKIKDLGDTEIIIFGHTHLAESYEKNGKLFINPGEAGGWLKGKSTICILYLPSKVIKFFEI